MFITLPSVHISSRAGDSLEEFVVIGKRSNLEQPSSSANLHKLNHPNISSRFLFTARKIIFYISAFAGIICAYTTYMEYHIQSVHASPLMLMLNFICL